MLRFNKLYTIRKETMCNSMCSFKRWGVYMAFEKVRLSVWSSSQQRFISIRDRFRAISSQVCAAKNESSFHLSLYTKEISKRVNVY